MCTNNAIISNENIDQSESILIQSCFHLFSGWFFCDSTCSVCNSFRCHIDAHTFYVTALSVIIICLSPCSCVSKIAIETTVERSTNATIEYVLHSLGKQWVADCLLMAQSAQHDANKFIIIILITIYQTLNVRKTYIASISMTLFCCGWCFVFSFCVGISSLPSDLRFGWRLLKQFIFRVRYFEFNYTQRRSRPAINPKSSSLWFIFYSFSVVCQKLLL